MKIRMKFNRRMTAGEVRAFEERKAAKERGDAEEKRTIRRREYAQPEETAGWSRGRELDEDDSIKGPAGRKKSARRKDDWEPAAAAGSRAHAGAARRTGKKERMDSGDEYGRGEKAGRKEGIGRSGKAGRKEGIGRSEKEDTGRFGAGTGKAKEMWNPGHMLSKRRKSEPEYDEYNDTRAGRQNFRWDDAERDKGSRKKTNRDEISLKKAGYGEMSWKKAGSNKTGRKETGWTKPNDDTVGMEESGREEMSYAYAGNAKMNDPNEQAQEGMNADYEADASLPKIEGRNAVLEAFRAGKTIDKLFVLEGCKDGPVQTILREAKKHDTIINFVDKERLIRMSGTKKHQGVIAVAAAYEYASVDDILQKAEEAGEQPFLILLDNIEDPHNLGAIIRTANLAGAHGIIIPKRRAVGLTGAVAKASAGAINYTPVAKVTNLNQTIKELKERGIWFVCADMEGEQMYRQNLTGPIGLVIGAEGAGVSRLVKENCDFSASIPMKGEIGSLNASTAAAVLSYEIVRQREFSNK